MPLLSLSVLPSPTYFGFGTIWSWSEGAIYLPLHLDLEFAKSSASGTGLGLCGSYMQCWVSLLSWMFSGSKQSLIDRQWQWGTKLLSNFEGCCLIILWKRWRWRWSWSMTDWSMTDVPIQRQKELFVGPPSSNTSTIIIYIPVCLQELEWFYNAWFFTLCDRNGGGLSFRLSGSGFG